MKNKLTTGLVIVLMVFALRGIAQVPFMVTNPNMRVMGWIYSGFPNLTTFPDSILVRKNGKISSIHKRYAPWGTGGDSYWKVTGKFLEPYRDTVILNITVADQRAAQFHNSSASTSTLRVINDGGVAGSFTGGTYGVYAEGTEADLWCNKGVIVMRASGTNGWGAITLRTPNFDTMCQSLTFTLPDCYAPGNDYVMQGHTDGTLDWVQMPPALSAGDFIQNQVIANQTAGFNITGNGHFYGDNGVITVGNYTFTTLARVYVNNQAAGVGAIYATSNAGGVDAAVFTHSGTGLNARFGINASGYLGGVAGAPNHKDGWGGYFGAANGQAFGAGAAIGIITDGVQDLAKYWNSTTSTQLIYIDGTGKMGINNITSMPNANITITADGTGKLNLSKVRCITYDTVPVNTISAGVCTVDWKNGNMQAITLDANITTLNFVKPIAPTTLHLYLNHANNTTDYTVAFPASVVWEVSAPTSYGTIANGKYLISFSWYGGYYRASSPGVQYAK